MKYSIFGLFFLCIISSLSAQPICEVKEFSANDGLAQSIVTGIRQDRKGFLWLSTWNGINKFDGYTFKNYKPSSQKEFAERNNRITFMAETLDGNIWCQTYDSKAYIFDCQKEIFVDVLQETEKEIQKNILVRHIYTFDDGVAWVVCEDGYCFRVNELHHDEKDSLTLYNTFNGGLKGNHILNIFQDSDKDEWILTDKGVTIIGDKKINNDFPFKLLHEHQGKIYLLSTSEKLAVYLPDKESVRFMEIPFPVNALYSLTSLRNNLLALATDNGVILYDPTADTFRQIDVKTKTQPSNIVLSIYEDKVGDCWVFTSSLGVMRINLETGEKQHLFTPEDEVVDYGRDSRNLIFEDNQGTLWVLPSKGNLGYFDREVKQLKTFYTESNNPLSSFTPLVRYSHEDQQGNQWIVGARGIKKMTFYPSIFNIKQMDDKGTEVRAFLLDQSKQLWVSSKSGCIRIYHPDGSLKGNLTPQGIITAKEIKFDANIYCFHQESDGTIWMGTKNNGLYQLRKRGDHSYAVKKFVHDNDDIYSLSSNDVYSIFTDSNGNTWVGCYGGGLNLLKKEGGGVIRFIHNKNELKNFPTEGYLNVRIISEVADSVMLIGTTSGIISFSNRFSQPEEIKFFQHKHNGSANAQFSMVGRDVMDIFTDSKGNTFVLTFTGGINKIVSDNLLNERICYKSYTTKDGLPSDLVLSMMEDDTGQVWVVSENALSKFDVENETFDNYDKTFLRYDFCFTEAIPTLNAQKQLVFGTDVGILEVAPEKLRKSAYVPPLAFTDLKIHGRQLKIPIDDIETLSLSPSQRNITVYFAALDYVRPEEVQYAYRLKGLEEQWNNSDKNRSVSYINLSAGDYQLEVRSTNSDGVWVDNVRTLPITVLPTFWETGWAWLVYTIALILFTFTAVYILFYIYRLRHEVRMEQEMSNIKLRFFTDISHELRTPLTLITTPITEVLENEPLTSSARKHLNLVHKNTERMLRLINQILDFRKIQNNKMKILAEKTELVHFISKVSESFILIAEEKDIDYVFQSSIDEVYLWIDRDKVEKIIFNLLSNAFKYTLPGKSIGVYLDAKNEEVSISVKDEGIGIDSKKLESLFKRFETLGKSNMMQPSSGIGLSLVKELVEMHHGKIRVESELDKGSVFCVTLPLERNVLEKDERIEFILTDSVDEKDLTVHPLLPSVEVERLEPESKGRLLKERETILIVEDNVELKILLESILKDRYNVVIASDGRDGLEKVTKILPNMVISDVMMPVMDGLEMIRQIKANREICHIPIIILSAKSSLDDRIEGIEQGIDDYITKPFSASYLRARVAALLAQRKQLQELFMSKLSDSNLQDTGILEPSKPQIMPYDEQFIKQVMDFMEKQMNNSELIVDDFASELSMSRSLFYRKLKSITGFAPSDFIREIRFKRAAQLIEHSAYNFSQIAYMIGFNDPKYFSKSFKKHTGLTPSEYKEKSSS